MVTLPARTYLLSDEIRDRRRSLLLTQRDAAELAGVSERFVRLVESGKRSVQLDKLDNLLGILGLTLQTRLRSPESENHG